MTAVDMDSALSDTNIKYCDLILEKIMSRITADDSLSSFFNLKKLKLEIRSDLMQVSFQLDHTRNKINFPSSNSIDEFDTFIHGMLTRRAERMFRFLKKLQISISQFGEMIQVAPEIVSITFSDGDSHGECERAIFFEMGGAEYVMKFRDPRPYLVLQVVLKKLQLATSIDTVPPDIWFSPNYEWHVMPFLDKDKDKDKNKEPIVSSSEFMNRLGALTAAAYFLQMTDVHFENVIVWNGTPIIVDAECMFYSYVEYEGCSAEDRLTHTGLVGMNPSLSSIRGGEHPVYSFGAKDECGKLVYLTPESGKGKNRFLDNAGNIVDPSKFITALCDGFCSAYEALCMAKEELITEIESIAKSGMKTRFLLKLTIQYAVTIEMLRKPSSKAAKRVIGEIVSSFAKAQGLSQISDNKTLYCELLDLLDSDIPLFWTEDLASGPALFHWSGLVKNLDNEDSLINRIRRSISSCSISDSQKLRSRLIEFLNAKEN